jgi:hypothetical protein
MRIMRPSRRAPCGLAAVIVCGLGLTAHAQQPALWLDDLRAFFGELR